jgi:hypothetical protein
MSQEATGEKAAGPKLDNYGFSEEAAIEKKKNSGMNVLLNLYQARVVEERGRKALRRSLTLEENTLLNLRRQERRRKRYTHV